MNNKEYVRKMLNGRDEIYIDTASLMDVEEMELLIKNYKDLFHECNCKITVLPAVCLELMRHLGSNNICKSNKSMQVLELFKNNPDLFSIQNEDLLESEVEEAFADPEIYIQILRDRCHKCKQLLITNDRGLSEDVYNLNKLQSMTGYPVAVCYLNHLGELHMCECVRTDNLKNQQQNVEEEKYTYEPDPIGIQLPNDSNFVCTSSLSALKTFVLIASGFMLGIGTAKLGTVCKRCL